jgi:hypothetical protein
MGYAVASTQRKPASMAVRGSAQSAWEPSGLAHAVLVKPRGGHQKVTMCGVPVGELHLFERYPFHGVGPWVECRDCRDWVIAERRRLTAAALGAR